MQDRRKPPPVTNGDDRARGLSGRFLIVRLSAVGDILHALPAAAALRRERPHARIDWIVEDRFAPMLSGHPAIDRVHVIPRSRWQRALRLPWLWPRLALEVTRLVGALWAARYDATIDLQGNAKSGLSSLVAGAPLRFGFRPNDVREGNALLTNRHVFAGSVGGHRVERALTLVGAALGRATVPYADAPLARGPGDRDWVDRALAEHGLPARGFAVLHPGTSGFGSFKRWPPERFGKLAGRLAADGSRVIVTIGPSEEALGAAVVKASAGASVVLAPPTLRALAELVSRARVFVSADTGPLHVAAAEGVPVVALFGPKDANVYGPYRPSAAGRAPGGGVVVTNADVPCRPCALRRCPDPVCMTSIDVESVLDGVSRALATGRA